MFYVDVWCRRAGNGQGVASAGVISVHTADTVKYPGITYITPHTGHRLEQV